MWFVRLLVVEKMKVQKSRKMSGDKVERYLTGRQEGGPCWNYAEVGWWDLWQVGGHYVLTPAVAAAVRAEQKPFLSSITSHPYKW